MDWHFLRHTFFHHIDQRVILYLSFRRVFRMLKMFRRLHYAWMRARPWGNYNNSIYRRNTEFTIPIWPYACIDSLILKNFSRIGPICYLRKSCLLSCSLITGIERSIGSRLARWTRGCWLDPMPRTLTMLGIQTLLTRSVLREGYLYACRAFHHVKRG